MRTASLTGCSPDSSFSITFYGTPYAVNLWSLSIVLALLLAVHSETCSPQVHSSHLTPFCEVRTLHLSAKAQKSVWAALMWHGKVCSPASKVTSKHCTSVVCQFNSMISAGDCKWCIKRFPELPQLVGKHLTASLQ